MERLFKLGRLNYGDHSRTEKGSEDGTVVACEYLASGSKPILQWAQRKCEQDRGICERSDAGAVPDGTRSGG